jgi:hypothetical protein
MMSIFYYEIVVLTARIPQIMIHNRMQRVQIRLLCFSYMHVIRIRI